MVRFCTSSTCCAGVGTVVEGAIVEVVAGIVVGVDVVVLGFGCEVVVVEDVVVSG